jgi:6-phosphogluconolactonase (cycloisomerase 2 family)
VTAPANDGVSLWVGCYTQDMEGEGEGIVALRRDARGAYQQLGAATPVASPTFLALHPSQPVLYAVSEGAAQVGAYRYDADGALDASGPVGTAGAYACHVAVDSGGEFLVVSCWGDGAVLLFELEPDGSLGRRHSGVASRDPHGEDRQSRAHACLMLGGGRMVTSDIGHDVLRLWRFSRGSGFEPQGTAVLPHGSGPRHFARSSRGVVYVSTEYSIEVAMLVPAASGGSGPALELRGMFPVSATGAQPDDAGAEICLDADERHLFVGVRGSNRICMLDIGADGFPTPAAEADCGGVWPRHHCIDAGRLLVALERSSALASFALGADGTLVGPPVLLRTGSPSCVLPQRLSAARVSPRCGWSRS